MGKGAVITPVFRRTNGIIRPRRDGQLEINPATPATPAFVVGPKGLNQLVPGLNADQVDGLHETAFALLAGRAGGQTFTGGTAASNSMTLLSTSNVTKGRLIFGSQIASRETTYDETTGRIKHQIHTANAATVPFHMRGIFRTENFDEGDGAGLFGNTNLTLNPAAAGPHIAYVGTGADLFQITSLAIEAFAGSLDIVLPSVGSGGSIWRFRSGAAGVGEFSIKAVSAGGARIEIGTSNATPLVILTNQIERARLDTAGRLFVGTTTGFGGIDFHAFVSPAGLGVNVLAIQSLDPNASSALDFFGESGIRQACVGWGNSATGMFANAAIFGALGASPILFYTNGLIRARFLSGSNTLQGNAGFTLEGGAGAHTLTLRGGASQTANAVLSTQLTVNAPPTNGTVVAAEFTNISNVSSATKVEIILRPDFAGGTAKFIAGRLATNTDGGTLDIQNTRSGGGVYASAIFINQGGDVGIGTSSPTERLDVAGGIRATALSLTGTATLADAVNAILGTTTGTKWGTAAAQKQAWYGAVPVVQQAGIVDADGTLADATAKFNSLLAKLETYGLLAVA